MKKSKKRKKTQAEIDAEIDRVLATVIDELEADAKQGHALAKDLDKKCPTKC